MLKFSDAAKAKDRVIESQKVCAQASEKLVALCEQLTEMRTKAAHTLIDDFERFINKLAKTPKDYGRTAELFRFNLEAFELAGENYAQQLEEALMNAKVTSGATVGLGAAAGAATAMGAPSAVMFVAMTFGTASTGTAISTLTGAVATKAALAWLGGGALVAGGGGMAAGNALLALAGPVGWALAGTAAAAGAGYAFWKNGDTIETADKIVKDLETATSEIKVKTEEVGKLVTLTVHHTCNFRHWLVKLAGSAPDHYSQFTDEQKAQIGSLHNHVLALARLIAIKPGEFVDVEKALEDSELAEARAHVEKEKKEKAAPSSEPYVPNFVIPSATADGNGDAVDAELVEVDTIDCIGFMAISTLR